MLLDLMYSAQSYWYPHAPTLTHTHTNKQRNKQTNKQLFELCQGMPKAERQRLVGSKGSSFGRRFTSSHDIERSKLEA